MAKRTTQSDASRPIDPKSGTWGVALSGRIGGLGRDGNGSERMDRSPCGWATEVEEWSAVADTFGGPASAADPHRELQPMDQLQLLQMPMETRWQRYPTARPSPNQEPRPSLCANPSRDPNPSPHANPSRDPSPTYRRASSSRGARPNRHASPVQCPRHERCRDRPRRQGWRAHSDDVGRAFRLMSATCSDRSRPAVPIDVGRSGGAPAGRV